MRTSGVADLAGRVLAGRYRLVAPIGTGASGQVYAAWDVRLNRRVAVKVLHAALAGDVGFLRRFGTEAQLAASLHHPNVVAVYDWGEDETPFMVLELLEGGSLRALLDAGTRLSVAQAAAVGGQVTAALEYAHSRGLVHRDVKPANLLFDEHGTARVADFGLARALAEASWTEPAGAVLGTARYAAPEQVRGVVDARSDLYSLALVLVEAVTGDVPFAGETSLVGLLSRVDRHLAVPPELGVLVPVLERAGRADPADRFGGAAAFGAALAAAAAGLSPPAPMPLAGTAGLALDPHPTTHIRPAQAVPLVAAGPAATPLSPPMLPEAPPPAAPDEPGGSGVSPGETLNQRAPRRLVPAVILFLVALAAGTAAFAVGRAAGPRARVPNLIGRTESDAQGVAGRRGLLVRSHRLPADDPPGTVVGQRPDPGTFLTQGRSILIDVSSGPAPVGLPGVTGRSEADARAALEAAGFEVSTTRRFDEQVPAGKVAAQDPAPGQPAPPGSEVHLEVSNGPAPVVVPNVVGDSYDDASKALVAKGFTVRRSDEYSDSVEAGAVMRQNPVQGGEAPRGSAVTLVVSKGPDLVEVPEVRGQDVQSAVATLEQAGLQVDVVGFRFGRTVRDQDPPRGTKVHRGETVTLYMR